MLKDIGKAVSRTLGYLVQAPVRALSDGSPRTVALDVAFRLTDKDYRPIGGVRIRLFPGRGDHSDPAAGTMFVTDDDGRAAYTTNAVIDKQWYWVNVGFTGLSMPFLLDHMAIAAELDNVIPAGAQEMHLALVCTTDIFRFEDGDCASHDFARIYAKDASGRFTRGVERDGIRIETAKGLRVLTGPCYRVAGFKIEPVTTDRWRLEFALIMSRITDYS